MFLLDERQESKIESETHYAQPMKQHVPKASQLHDKSAESLQTHCNETLRKTSARPLPNVFVLLLHHSKRPCRSAFGVLSSHFGPSSTALLFIVRSFFCYHTALQTWPDIMIIMIIEADQMNSSVPTCAAGAQGCGMGISFEQISDPRGSKSASM